MKVREVVIETKYQLIKKFKRSIAHVADLHTGCPYAPWPDGIFTKEGVPIPPSKSQVTLNEYWTRFCNTADEFKVDAIFMYGDMVHGNNRREWGRQTMTADLNVQVEACLKLMRKLCKKRSVVGVSGSQYHDSLDVRLDKIIIDELGGEWAGLLANQPVKDTKRIIQMAHGVSSAYVYREQVMGKESKALWIAEGKGKLPFHIDMKVGGHWHHYFHIHGEKQHLLQLPGWTDWVPWKGGIPYYGERIPDIGACIMLVDEQDRMTVYPFTYPRPLIADGLRRPI